MRAWCGVTTVVALALAFAAPASAKDVLSRSSGGGGGAAFSARCAPGDYLVGLQGRSGHWVDAIAPLCAAWRADRERFDVPGLGQQFGSPRGGAPNRFRCDDQSAVTALLVESARNEWGSVGLLAPRCAGLNGKQRKPAEGQRFGTSFVEHIPDEPGVGTSAAPYYDESAMPRCPSGHLAVGIFGAAGNLVDRIGLICAPVPRTRADEVRRSTQGPVADAAPKPRTPADAVRIGAQGGVAAPAPRTPADSVRLGGQSSVAVSGRQRAQPDACKPGFVWREARPGDLVCVTPNAREVAAAENQALKYRVDPNGPYGPNSCKGGFVWREAFEGDVACVSPERRDAVREENRHQYVNRIGGGAP